MKQIVITMELGKIEAWVVGDDCWEPSQQDTRLGMLVIDPDLHSNYMRSEQISGFLDSVVWTQLNGFAREIETEEIERADANREIGSGEAP